ncbi:hypothetical protein OROMI_009411 [Orobanche minor]
MAGITLIFSVVVLLFVSLCKVLHGSVSTMKASFSFVDGSSRRRNVMLVIAHPDDEFFAPVIRHLISMGHNMHILCISTGFGSTQTSWNFKILVATVGNADGMGNIRKEELYMASTILKIPTQQVNILDHPDLQDGFGKAWDWNILARIIDNETRAYSIDLIITFDDYGVSGHCNHRDLHQGVRKLLYDESGRNLEAWELVSTNLIRKYVGPVDIWFSILLARCQGNGRSHCFVSFDPRTSYAAMAQHYSQWVWFRKLFVAFSSYTYVNMLKKIN